MATSTTQTRFTPADLLQLNDERLYELVDGNLLEKHRGPLTARTSGIACGRVLQFLDRHPLGDVLPLQTFQCFPHEADRVRRPDIAGISCDRSSNVPDDGHISVPPELVIELVTSHHTVYEMDERLLDYRIAGVKLVWVINPKTRTLRIHRLDQTAADLAETDTLSGESVLPGFSILVRDLLPPRK